MIYKILTGDNRETLKTLEDNSIDAIVTDPPYGIDFLGKAWDANTGALETYQECLRVLKPGGHILAFSAARTYHHLAVTLEQAGFEIRDQIMWIYSSGFPKSQDIGRQLDKKEIDNDWSGWGTALKPAHEPIALARKPLKQSIAKNCQQWATGALNIDAARIDWDDGESRYPSNVLGDIPLYQKYFYCPKVSRNERHVGFGSDSVTQASMLQDMGGHYTDAPINQNIWLPQTGNIYIHGLKHEYEKWCQANGVTAKVGNNHPTVKPVALMEYLIKLITPPGGTVLDPFNGSGSTGMAAAGLGYNYIGCELDPAYVAITEKRIAAWLERDLADNTFSDLFEHE
jgi:DNA modification methylase